MNPFNKAQKHAFARDERGQISTEYLLLLALGMLIVIIGVTIALQLKTLSDFVAARTAVERNATMAMLVK